MPGRRERLNGNRAKVGRHGNRNIKIGAGCKLGAHERHVADAVWFSLLRYRDDVCPGCRLRFKPLWDGVDARQPAPIDLMIVAGRVSRKMAPVLRRLYDQMPEPKWVISMGDCASCGGVFNNYAIVQGVDEVVPVDVYVAGCPPRPEALIHGIITLHEKVRGEKISDWSDLR